jgi:putative ABC transport system permease protein
MRTPIGWHNLTHDRPRTAVAIAGVTFTLTIIFMQIGFIKLVAVTATILLEKLDFDAVVVSKDYTFLAESQDFSRQLLDRAASVTGVREAVPFYLSDGTWRNGANPEPEVRGQRRMSLVMGMRLGDRIFRAGESFDPREVEGRLDELHQPDTLLVDRQSRPEYLPIDVGRSVEVGARQATIVGHFSIGSGFSADSSMIVSAENFERIFGSGRLRRVNFGLVRLEPGSDLETVVQGLRAALPSDQVQVLSRSEIEGRETRFWLFHKSIGIMFLLGVAVAFAVGVVVVFQVLSSDIAEHFAEYATLKAIGRTGLDVARVVVSQALVLAVAAYVPALLAAVVLYRVTSRVVLLPLTMDVPIALSVFVLANLICAVSAVVSVRKLQTADPADLF